MLRSLCTAFIISTLTACGGGGGGGGGGTSSASTPASGTTSGSSSQPTTDAGSIASTSAPVSLFSGALNVTVSGQYAWVGKTISATKGTDSEVAEGFAADSDVYGESATDSIVYTVTVQQVTDYATDGGGIVVSLSIPPGTAPNTIFATPPFGDDDDGMPTPIPLTTAVDGAGQTLTATVDAKGFLLTDAGLVTRLSLGTSTAPTQSASVSRRKALDATPAASATISCPLAACTETSRFGGRVFVKSARPWHDGTDFAAECGTAISVPDGSKVLGGQGPDEYDYRLANGTLLKNSLVYLDVQYPSGSIVRFMHLYDIVPSLKTATSNPWKLKVKTGDASGVIAHTGNSGKLAPRNDKAGNPCPDPKGSGYYAPHLHVELNNKTQDAFTHMIDSWAYLSPGNDTGSSSHTIKTGDTFDVSLQALDEAKIPVSSAVVWTDPTKHNARRYICLNQTDTAVLTFSVMGRTLPDGKVCAEWNNATGQVATVAVANPETLQAFYDVGVPAERITDDSYTPLVASNAEVDISLNVNLCPQFPPTILLVDDTTRALFGNQSCVLQEGKSYTVDQLIQRSSSDLNGNILVSSEVYSDYYPTGIGGIVSSSAAQCTSGAGVVYTGYISAPWSTSSCWNAAPWTSISITIPKGYVNKYGPPLKLSVHYFLSFWANNANLTATAYSTSYQVIAQ